MRATILERLQRAVERLHGFAAELDVADFLVGPDVWRHLPGAREGLVEQLFVRHDPENDDVDIALYIAPEIVEALQRDDPIERLHAGNLESFCVALEGISHFVLVAWRARRGRPVSPLELEIQAEVDKFVAAWLLLAEQGAALELSARGLLRQLFERYALRDEVAVEEADRYHVASRVAHNFCGLLVSRYARQRDPVRQIEHAVRRFAAQGMAEKLRAA